jgi:hypothetical protein
VKARAQLRALTVPAATAYVLITVLTLVFRSLSLVAGLLTEITEVLADAGDTARDSVRGPVLITSAAGPRPTAAYAAAA